MKKLSKAQEKKFIKNLKKFTFPFLAGFFAQLALGASFKVAFITGLIIFWGVLADFFSKAK